MAEHTPGPWTIGSHGYGNVKGFNSGTAQKFRRVRSGDVEVARVWCGDCEDERDSRPQDTMLILAAPELLAACHKLIDADLAVEEDERTHQRRMARIMAQAAVAKAEGRINV